MGKFCLSLSSFFFFFPLSLAVPQFGLLSHVSSLRLPSGHSGPVLTLSTAAHASLFSPRLLVADVSVLATCLLGFSVRRVICGFYFFLSVMLPSEIPKLPKDLLVRGFPGVWKPPSPGWVSVPNFFVSLFIFYLLSYLLSKTMGCLSGCLVSSASIQKLFCGICSAFK